MFAVPNDNWVESFLGNSMMKVRDSYQESRRNKNNHNHHQNVPYASENVESGLCSLQCFGEKKGKGKKQ